jgi:hypothetical protein
VGRPRCDPDDRVGDDGVALGHLDRLEGAVGGAPAVGVSYHDVALTGNGPGEGHAPRGDGPHRRSRPGAILDASVPRAPSARRRPERVGDRGTHRRLPTRCRDHHRRYDVDDHDDKGREESSGPTSTGHEHLLVRGARRPARPVRKPDRAIGRRGSATARQLVTVPVRIRTISVTKSSPWMNWSRFRCVSAPIP